MRRTAKLTLIAGLSCGLATACDEPPTRLASEGLAPAFAKPGACPGHPSCDGGGDDEGDGSGSTADLDAIFGAAPAGSGSLTGDGGGAYLARVNELGNFQTRIAQNDRRWRENRDRCLTVHVARRSDGATIFGPECVAIDNLATKAVDGSDVTLAGLAVGASGSARASVLFGRGGNASWLSYGRAEDDCDIGTQAPSDDATKITVTRTAEDAWTLEGGDAVYCGPDGVPVDANISFRIEAVAR